MNECIFGWLFFEYSSRRLKPTKKPHLRLLQLDYNVNSTNAMQSHGLLNAMILRADPRWDDAQIPISMAAPEVGGKGDCIGRDRDL